MRAIMPLFVLALTGLVPLPCAADLPDCDDVNEIDMCMDYPLCICLGIEWSPIECDAQGHKMWRCRWYCEGYGYFESSWAACDCSGQAPPCDCLLAGTPVTLADGSTKPVEAIQQGDRVLAFDETTRTVAPSEVTSVHRPFLADHYFVINGNLRLTQNHPILSRGRWIPAGELKVGDWLTTADGRDVPVVSIIRVDEAAMAYNFRVAASTYVAQGVVVHNKANCNEYMMECNGCPGP